MVAASCNILSLHYLPCISWFHALLSGHHIIDLHEHYTKQSYRNRALILTGNGPIALTIPVKAKNHTPVIHVPIENDFNWQKNHWQTICSAYNTSPFFEHYAHQFELLYSKPQNSLAQFNLELITLVLKLMKVDLILNLSEAYAIDGIDLRNTIHPKKDSFWLGKTYLQVFSEKHAFIPDLSIIDLLFNCGPNAVHYLK